MLRVKYYSTDEFDSLSRYWRTLENGKDMTAFQSYSWYTLINEQCKKRAILIPGKGFYAVCFDDNKVKMIAPLYIVKFPRFVEKYSVESGAYILGKWGFTDYLNFIYNDFSEEVFKFLIEQIKLKFKIKKLFLHQILPGTAVYNFIDNNCKNSLDFCGDCARIIPSETYEEYWARLHKSVRRNLKTHQNRAKNNNINLHYQLFKNVSEKDAEEFYNIYIKRNRIRNEKNSENNNKTIVDFVRGKIWAKSSGNYNIITEAFQRLDSCVLIGFFADNKKVGFCFGLEDSEAIRIPIVCFDNDYSWYSPGIVCLSAYLKDSYENGTIKIFDLTRGTEQYKFELGAELFSIGYFKIEL